MNYEVGCIRYEILDFYDAILRHSKIFHNSYLTYLSNNFTVIGFRTYQDKIHNWFKYLNTSYDSETDLTFDKK